MLFEKLYIVNNLPDLSKYKKIEIKQWFINKEDDSNINSIICYNKDRYIFYFNNFTSEIEFETKFKDIKKLLKYKPYLSKDKYIIKNNKDVEMSLHVYKENLKGLNVLKYFGKNTDGFNIVFNWKPCWEWVGEEIDFNIDYSEFKLAKKNMINKKNIKKLYNIIDEVIRKDLKEEAKKIANNMNDEQSSSLVMYYEDNNLNSVCMEFDRIKQELVENNIMKQNIKDNFGKWNY
jgi:hypothetical protein